MARAPAKQAHWAVMQMQAHGQRRAQTRAAAGRQSSVGTTRSYEQSLRGLAAHLHAGRLRDPHSGRVADLRSVTLDQIRAWLAARAAAVAQSTLDRDRQAAQAWLSHRSGARVAIARAAHRSGHPGRDLAHQSRVYTPEQLDRVQARQSPAHALATQVAREAGLRAHELATLRPAQEQPATLGRQWRADRFVGRTGVTYTVIGKGGLCRAVQLSPETAARLEAVRLAAPRMLTDRGVHYEQRYALGHGQAWSQSFSRASKTELGWSAGAHAVRHVYAQQRLDELQQRGYAEREAKAVVAQEVGHFKAETTEAYLR